MCVSRHSEICFFKSFNSAVSILNLTCQRVLVNCLKDLKDIAEATGTRSTIELPNHFTCFYLLLAIAAYHIHTYTKFCLKRIPSVHLRARGRSNFERNACQKGNGICEEITICMKNPIVYSCWLCAMYRVRSIIRLQNKGITSMVCSKKPKKPKQFVIKKTHRY